ncbi:hypothetical protein [Mesoterricola sediminis]|uniref:JAB domain-containing protein n=1 Tax=Mesoterricola sediminis TaxID=2927980 RepID=A0AA48GW71_9BACT|nr:hypothetical protein [Mesoterricola sediminis]BDU76780.1 hypothetical protein METESE_17380 [Mesoterricola sediminis]
MARIQFVAAWMLCGLLPAFEAAPGPLFEVCGRQEYFKGKHGFQSVGRASEHAYKEFRALSRAEQIHPQNDEYFSYILRWEPEDGPPLYLHTAWQRASGGEREGNQVLFQVACPVHTTDTLRVYTLMHSHPTAWGSPGPSWMDLETATRYTNPDGSFRHLYLINNRGQLVAFKAKRSGGQTGRIRHAHPPRRNLDWLD